MLNNLSAAGFSDIKYLDLPIRIGGPLSLSCKASIDKLLNDIRLDLGSTYYFTVYYMDKPLTKIDIPLNPIKYQFIDLKRGFTDIKTWEFYSQLAVTDKELKSLLYIYKDKPLAFHIYILTSAIHHLIFSSDLIKDVIENDYKKYVWANDCLKPKRVSVNRNYILALTLVYYKSSQ